WPKGDLRELCGRTVRFKIGFQKTPESAPHLYALYLRSAAKRSTGVASASATEFSVTVGKRSVNARLLSPAPERLAADPALLLTFAMDRRLSISITPYCLTTEYFLAQGHRVVSFDLPMHGERVDTYGSDIVGMRNAFVAGKEVFAEFVEEGKAVIDECIRRGWAKPGRIAVAGTSRGGYMALRLMAGDERIAAGAGFAPVTDWALLKEFAEDRERADVQALRLANFAPQMAGRHVYLAIGNKDERVGTQSCKQLAEQLAATDPQCVEFHLTEDEGHSLNDSWYGVGRESLLKWVQAL
ncbi:MAG: prolyl oligopeptidase family serine peptidase, partial [FCB group bacterium]|nr:prolyl oligopeptidase family serine peptidase [FCB group bacterium]